MNKPTNIILFLAITTFGIFLVSVPKAQSVSASAQAKAVTNAGSASAQSSAQTQDGSSSASSAASSADKTESSTTSNSSSEFYASPYSETPAPPASQEKTPVQEPVKPEPAEDTSENEKLSELVSLLKQNKEKLEVAEQKLNGIEKRQVRLLEMFITNLAIIIIIVCLEIVLVLKTTKRHLA